MSQATASPRHAACEHLDADTCSYCDTDTVFFFIYPPNATLRERMTGTLIDVIRHGGAHRADPVSLVKAPAAMPSFFADELYWPESDLADWEVELLRADDLPRHLFAR